MKLLDVWTSSGTNPGEFRIARQNMFADLTEDQLQALRYVKYLTGCKLFERFLTQEFNKMAQYDMSNLLTEIVIKVKFTF